jgi:hypothetical protein
VTVSETKSECIGEMWQVAPVSNIKGMVWERAVELGIVTDRHLSVEYFDQSMDVDGVSLGMGTLAIKA